jgi:FkbM family methyltransferase
VLAGGAVAVRIPAEFVGADWESYERECIAALGEWLSRYPGGRVLDVGCSLGIFSAVSLFADPTVEVVGFDADLASLAAAKRMCQYGNTGNLQLVYGFLSDDVSERSSLEAAVAATEAELLRASMRGELGATRYAGLAEANLLSTPVRRLDDLFSAEDGEGRPRSTLLKCDVEGAELLVLRGAADFLRRVQPTLLVSVHPSALPDYRHSVAQVASFLEGLGYGVRCLAVDHEEHWWCEVREGSRRR